MATGSFQVAFVPKSSTFTVGSATAGRLVSSSLLAVKFTIVAPPANTARIYIGDSAVSSTRGIPLTGGSIITFGEDEPYGSNKHSFDLAEFWVRATAASQTGVLIRYLQKKDQ